MRAGYKDQSDAMPIRFDAVAGKPHTYLLFNEWPGYQHYVGAAPDEYWLRAESDKSSAMEVQVGASLVSFLLLQNLRHAPRFDVLSFLLVSAFGVLRAGLLHGGPSCTSFVLSLNHPHLFPWGVSPSNTQATNSWLCFSFLHIFVRLCSLDWGPDHVFTTLLCEIGRCCRRGKASATASTTW